MIVQVYALYDRVGGFYGSPFFQQTDGLAKRALFEMANDLETQIGRHPADFQLFHLGAYDNLTARFEFHQNPVMICTALSLVRRLPDTDGLPLSSVPGSDV